MMKKRNLGKRLLSVLLSAMLMIGSVDLSGMTVHAAEVTESSTEEESREEVVESNTEEESTETSAPACTTEDVKAMLDALPSVSELEAMSEEELNSVYEQA